MMWILLLLLLGGGAYVAMDPDIVMDLLNPLLGEPVSTPPLAQIPPPKPAAPRPAPSTPSPAPQSAPMDSAPPGPSAVPAPPSTPVPGPTAQAKPFADPQFGEGQRVTIAGTAGPLGVKPGRRAAVRHRRITPRARSRREPARHHRDRFERMPIAQCLCERLTLATCDRKLASCGVDLLWA